MGRSERKPKESLLIQEDCGGYAKNVVEFRYFDSQEMNAGWNPNMDIFETETEIIVLIEAAGLNEDTLRLHSVDNRLVVSGDRHLDSKETIRHFHQLEIQFLPFRKTIILPGAIDAAHVTAKYRNGMLTISVTKKDMKQRNENG